MTKQEYMNELKAKLGVFGDDIMNEIVSDYEEHFRMGLGSGKTEDQICQELGSIDELVSELNKLTGREASEGAKSEAKFRFDEDTIREAAENFAGGMNDVMKNFASFLGNVAASVSRGTEKFGANVTESAGNFSSKAGEYAKNVMAGLGSAAEKVANKSEEFAKEVSDSYRKAMSKEAAQAAAEADTEGEEDTPEDPFEEPIDPEFEFSVEDEVEELRRLDGDLEEPEEGDLPADTNSVVSEGECDSVIIETDCGDVHIEASEDRQIHFNYENNGTVNQQLAYGFDFIQEGKTIYAIAKKKPGTTNFFKSMSCPDIDVTVLIPEGLKNVSVRVMSGDIDCEDVSVEQFSISSLSGDVNLDNCMVKALEINTMSGDIELSDCTVVSSQLTSVSGNITSGNGAAQTVNLKTTSGDIEYDDTDVSDVKVNSVSGDVHIDLGKGDGYLAHVKTTCGDVNLSYNDEELSIIRSGNYVLGAGEIKLNITTVSGDISVEA